MGDRAAEHEVLEAYERLVAIFREGRWAEKFACFAQEATVVDGGHWFGSLDEYRSAWERWMAGHDSPPVPLSVDTRVLKVQLHGEAAVLTHSIESLERTDSGERTVREIESMVFGKQPDGRWLVLHQHLSPQPD